MIQLPPDSAGKKQRERKLTVNGQAVYEDVVTLDDGQGNLLDPRQIRPLTNSDHVTADAGLNLNTSALALETGGNLASLNNKAALLALESGGNLASIASKTPLANGATLLLSYGIGIPDLTGLLGLNGPRDAFELANGNWLITDMMNNRVIEVNPKTKQIIWQYGTTGVAGSDANQLNNPYSAIRLANGDTLIADCSNNRIIEVTPTDSIVWTATGSSLGLGSQLIWPTSVQMTDEGTVVCGGNQSYPHVLEINYSTGALVCDWSANAVPAFSWPTYAHKVQGNEVNAQTDFYNWHHMLVVDWNLGEFYNFNPNSGSTPGTLLFATARYAALGSAGTHGALECVDMWSSRIALLTCSWIGAVLAYIKTESLDKLGLLFGNKSAASWNGMGRALPFISDTGYCHRTPDGNLLISDYGSDMVYKVTPALTKFISPSPLSLWVNQSITGSGSTTLGFLTAYVDKKTFYIYSTQAGTLNIQVWDEVKGAFETIASMAVAANTLTPYMTTYGARLMALNFVPSNTATVSAWAVLDE